MDAVKASLGSAFDSKRLLFRPLEFNEGDMNYISVHLRSDPVSTGLTLPALHRPFSRTISDELAKTQMESALLTVKVCVGGSLHSTAIGTLHITEVGKYQRRATIAVQIAQGYQGQGYGFEAINWAMDWSFKWAGMHSLEVETAAYNERAIAVFMKAGFTHDGVTREAIYRDRKWHDIVHLAILEQEWEVLRAIDTDKHPPQDTNSTPL